MKDNSKKEKYSCDIKLNAVQKIRLVLYDLACYLQASLHS